MSDDEHIINWILKKTEIKESREYINKKNYKKRKYTIDNTTYFCEECKQVWTKVPHYVDLRKRMTYPKGNIPTIGKKRKRCYNCKKTK
tara:strand:- start:49 stop:312 length:264 start_codon:yes stop_codon:yes gene_type:complete